MDSYSTVSSYLTKPRRIPSRHRSWQGFRTQLFEIRRIRSHVGARTVVGLLIWVTVGWSWHYVTTHRELPGQAKMAALTNPLTTDTRASNPDTLNGVSAARALPGGPTGQLLPPGSLAADRTYANSYSRGQCTWYVAGRRQLPNNWGNAVSWYYHATASGRAVGTTPAVGAIAWTPVGRYGHVALVEQVSSGGTQVYISEMNYRGVGVKSYRWVSAKSFKYIY